MTEMNENPLGLLPEVLLAASAVLGLLLGSWLPRARQWAVGLLAAVACVAGIVAASVAAAEPATAIFGDAFAVDTVTSASRIVVLVGTLLVLGVSFRPLRGDGRESEFYVLVQLAGVGALMMAGAQDLLLLAAAYLLASIPSYTLAGFRKDGPGTEAALKYYVIGALLGVLMLTGIAVLYATGRATGYPMLGEAFRDAPKALVAAGTVGLLAGVLFKAGGVPAHFWVPDAVQGSSPPVAALLTTIPKIGALAALFRLGDAVLADSTLPWAALVAVLAAASMTLGNLAAFFQQDVKRLLAYSTISQVGYLLMPVAVAGRSDLAQQALLYYVAAYAVTNLGAFAVVCALPRAHTLDDYRGLARERPLLAASLVICLLGLVGTPPTAVFLGKLEAFSAAFDGGYAWLAVLAAVNTVASLFYYLRWIVPAVSRSGPPTSADGNSAARIVAYTAAAISLGLGIAGGPVLDALG
ncbi:MULTISPECIES: NADH-quinone oxidoreductase subunit N [unclassified Streptomyces]|uniref:NADH-quinone oxidoreductase subunit N n=1 Tax=unclassified Streptomyces TaxID=2593676 RepID=UPI0022526960|nr:MULTISPECIES: NADH-quinone oxidoreductase subunit N [unclassified Streptomyces]MCX5328691.1 NADH-quinone oxidoreductase subunit N [Streptomyces sp. NBC_00140]MCX5358104.1 NADH-quinone oxidoreductase subunit N [Streptomyces sp. NBC_00124]